MSIDRYLNVVHETSYRRYRKPKYAFIICILIWTGLINNSLISLKNDILLFV